MRSERARTDQSLPKVDWNRYHLQVSPGLAIPRHHVSQCLNTVLYKLVCNAIASKQFCQGCRSSCESVSCSRTLFVLSSFTSAKPVRLQILFVDRSDTVRARVAAGLLERIAEWNGYGRALYPCACGVEAAQVGTYLLRSEECQTVGALSLPGFGIPCRSWLHIAALQV